MKYLAISLVALATVFEDIHAHEQLLDRTQQPNAANEGIAKSLAEQCCLTIPMTWSELARSWSSLMAGIHCSKLQIFLIDFSRTFRVFDRFLRS